MNKEDAERRLIRERAAEWVCELQEEDAPGRYAEFCAWVQQSPRHIEDFLFAAAAWKALDGVGPKDAAEVEEAIGRALALAGQNSVNVIALQAGPKNPHTVSSRFSRRQAIAAGIAALIATAGLAWWSISTFVLNPTYVTAAGEQRTVRLPDGSVLYLNTESRAQLRFSDSARNVRLATGEALFVVAPDSARPFRVTAGTAVIQAVGTQFNVRRRTDETKVSVIEGRVKVIEGQKENTLLGAGEEATITSGGPNKGRIARRSTPEVADAIAWRERRLVFRGDTLEHIAAEVNRYSPQRRLRVEGDAVRHRRFAGTFSADDPQALVRFLEQYEDLSVSTVENEVVIRQR